MEKMKVSIIIPVYNTEQYVEECIQSALNQTYKNIEVIVVNDGSTDNSLQIIRKYSDRIKIINKENGGTASAFNAGMRVMSGEWFKWGASDDVLYENAIEILVEAAKKLGNEAKNCIFCTDVEIIDSTGKKIGGYLEPKYNNLDKFERNVTLLDRFVGNGTTCFIHKSMFERFGFFNEEIGFQEDYEFYLRVCFLHNCRIFLIPKITAKYRLHENQTQKRLARKQKNKNIGLENTKKIQEMILNQLDRSIKKKYLERLELLRKRRNSKKAKTLRKIRDSIFNLFPEPTSKKLIESSIKYRKKISRMF